MLNSKLNSKLNSNLISGVSSRSSSADDRDQLRCGFSLLELLIVVMLIGLLAMLALPSYSSYIVKANRADAKEKLSEVMFEQERYFLRMRTYTLKVSELGFALDSFQGVKSNEGFYSVVAQPCALTVGLRKCVELVARPVPNLTQGRAGEEPLTLNSLGEKSGPWR